MKKNVLFALCVMLVALGSFTFVSGQKRPAGPILGRPATGKVAERGDALRDLVDRAAAQVLEKYKAKGLKPENLAISLMDLRYPGDEMPIAEFNGHEKIYAASVV